MTKRPATFAPLISDTAVGPIPPRVDNAEGPGTMHIKIQEVVSRMGPAPWATKLIEDERNWGTLIASNLGEGNRAHWHSNFDEWWVVMAGTLRWELTGGKIIHACKGDVVWIPRGTVHHIVTEGDDMSLRFAISLPPAVHIWENDCENCDMTWKPATPNWRWALLVTHRPPALPRLRPRPLNNKR